GLHARVTPLLSCRLHLGVGPFIVGFGREVLMTFRVDVDELGRRREEAPAWQARLEPALRRGGRHARARSVGPSQQSGSGGARGPWALALLGGELEVLPIEHELDAVVGPQLGTLEERREA